MMKNIGFEEVIVGAEVEIEEQYSDLVVHLRGTVSSWVADMICLGGNGYTRAVVKANANRQRLRIRMEQPDPPTKAGSVVKFYDGDFLCYSTATRGPDGEWYDLVRARQVDLSKHEWTVLFDAAKDS